MPVTAKFSENFYSRLGHDVADEPVDWFNKLDETYRSEFRELFADTFEPSMPSSSSASRSFGRSFTRKSPSSRLG